MYRFLQAVFLHVVPLLLAGCSGVVVKAPVDARGNQDVPPGSSIPPAVHTRHKPAPGGAAHVVVKRGDTLYSIAWQHGLNYRQLAAYNGIRYPYTIYAGQRLSLKPVAAGYRPAAPVQAEPARPRRPLPAPARLPRTSAARPPPAAPSREAANVPAAAAVIRYDGHWIWPTRGRVLRSFRTAGQGKKGIDIGGHDGQPVKAAANGKVVYAGSGLVGYGRLIIIKHNEILLSAYGHNSKLLVAEGEYVKAGQQIAEMGSSGTNRTELYFEIRKDGKPVDPLRYLPSS